MLHLQVRCKVSDTGAPSLSSTTVILTVFKDRTILRDTTRRYNILVAYQLHRHLRNLVKQGLSEDLAVL